MRKGESAFIKCYKDPEIGKNLMTIGLLPDSSVRYVRKAPLGGAVYVNIDGQNIALRNSEAKNIVVKENHTKMNE